MVVSRIQSVHYFLLQLGGVDVGFIKSFEGGNAVADVVEEGYRAIAPGRKHLGSVRYEPIILGVDIGTLPPLFNWIADWLNFNPVPKSGTVIITNAEFKPLAELEFTRAWITAVGFPGMDASAKDVSFLTIRLQPESARLKNRDGKIDTMPDLKAQKKWLPANFQFQLGGLDTTRVSRIEGFTITQELSEDFGIARPYEGRQYGQAMKTPNLTVTLSADAADTWRAWFEDFVIKGNNFEDKERNGSITYLAPDLNEKLLTLNLSKVGIFGLKPARTSTGAFSLADLVAGLYCERITLDPA